MKYYSTRHQQSEKASLSFADVLFSPGYSKDGGLYVPEKIPKISIEELGEWKGLSYRGIVEKILRLYTSPSELTDGDIKDLVSSSFHDFELPDEVIHLEHLEPNVLVAELFRGPTLAFKDLSLNILAKLLEFFLKKEKERRLTILVATSGDTGPAAAHSVSNLKNLDLVLLYPLNRVSEVQEIQMLTMDAPNIHVVAGEGTSDDLDVPVKEVFCDTTYAEANHLGSLNSIQWGRVVLQTAHYIYVYLKCCSRIGQPVTIVVPTGAAGNVAAGVIVRTMGFPIKLVCSVTVNDIVARAHHDGDFSIVDVVQASLAPAMDIQAPYNLERVLYLASGGDSHAVREAMDQFEKCGRTVLPAALLDALRSVITESVAVDDQQITEAVKKCYERYNYVVCPHTATALHYVFNRDTASKKGSGAEEEGKEKEEEEVLVCLATASPAKFADTIQSALIGVNPTNPRLEQLKMLHKNHPRPAKHTLRRGDDWNAQLRQIIADI